MPKPPEDRCECRGACAKHEKRCPTLFGQAHLYDAYADQPMFSKYGKDKRLCSSCAPTYDPTRRSREARSERALTEAASDQQRVVEGLMEWHRRVHGK